MCEWINVLAIMVGESITNVGGEGRRCVWVREEGVAHQSIKHSQLDGVCREAFED